MRRPVHGFGWPPFSIAALCLSLTVVLNGAEPKIVTPEYNKMTDADEVALGKEAARQIEAHQKLQFITSARVVDYVNRVTQKVAAQSRRPQLTYTAKVVDSTVVNAFALPGGLIYVERGLIERVSSEAELVAVLAHEVGHVVGRHGANNISRYLSANSLLREFMSRIVGNEWPAQLVQTVGGPVAFLTLMKYSRTDELQADLLGYYNMQRAGWSVDGMVTLFEQFEKDAPPSSFDSLLSIVGSHPSPSDRKAQVLEENRISSPKPALTRNSDEFMAIQAEVRKLPRRSPSPAR